MSILKRHLFKIYEALIKVLYTKLILNKNSFSKMFQKNSLSQKHLYFFLKKNSIKKGHYNKQRDKNK